MNYFDLWPLIGAMSGGLSEGATRRSDEWCGAESPNNVLWTYLLNTVEVCFNVGTIIIINNLD